MLLGGFSYSPNAFPLDRNIRDDRVQLRPNPVILILWKHDSPAIVAVFERIDYLWSVIFFVAVCSNGAGLAIVSRARGRRSPRTPRIRRCKCKAGSEIC